MSVLDVCIAVAREVGIAVPSSIFGASGRTEANLGNRANDAYRRICFQSHEWKDLIATATITGDGSTTAWPLSTVASDYRRMLKDTQMHPSDRPYSTLQWVPRYNTWLMYEVQAFSPVTGFWNLSGGNINIKPALDTGVTVKFGYISNLIADGGTKTAFDADDDEIDIGDEDLLRLGMVWKWRERRGMPYADDLADYTEWLSQWISDDRGSSILRLNQPPRRMMGHALAYPATITE